MQEILQALYDLLKKFSTHAAHDRLAPEGEAAHSRASATDSDDHSVRARHEYDRDRSDGLRDVGAAAVAEVNLKAAERSKRMHDLVRKRWAKRRATK